MPPKRKRQEENPQAQPEPESDPAAARRATRQTPVYPPLPLSTPPQNQAQSQAQHQNQSQTPAPIAGPLFPPVQSPVPIPIPPEQAKRGRVRPSTATSPSLAQQQQQSRPAVQTTLPSSWRVPPSPQGRADMASVAAVKDHVRPSNLVAPEITYHVPQAAPPGRPTTSLVRPHGPSAKPPPTPTSALRLSKPAPPPAVVTPVLPPKPPTLTAPEKPPPRADRNIDKVVFGNLCFRTWYPSYYGKEVLGDLSSNARGGSKDSAVDAGGKPPSKKDRDHHHMLERLYVCPSCFKYSKELVAWWGHVRACESQGFVPGRKIYVHPRGTRKVLIPYDGSKGPGPKKRRGDGGIRYIEQVVQDEGEWSIWEVDGEKDGVSLTRAAVERLKMVTNLLQLFCQNLSLFAKLFLDNKSVFFDVTGFNYFLLVYTPPPPPPPPPAPAPAAVQQSTDISATGLPQTTAQPISPPRPQVTGFFSKEKMSWDNNNLACILVFPPWQRKGLGGLLMGASYEISRREGVLGGPEKPISDLGKKGYKRFWAGEIARWLLTTNTSPGEGHEVVVDVNDCSQATWISPEDCLAVLREMAVAEDAGLGPAKKPRREEKADEHAHGQHPQQPQHPATEESGAEREKSPVVKQVPRVKVDKDAVRRWVAQHRISLERACDAAGFVEGYAMKQSRQASEEEDGDGDED
ncbi:Histone acetyltransferase [Paramyrothecium foliicola]|nr:Histone acetyltransferase [Paramyrothecium foliicola]